MDWTTLGAAFVGGGLGGVIPAVVSVMQFRRDKKQALQARRWVDAEVVADTQTLLMDLDPIRRTLNADSSPGAEQARWKTLNERKDQLYRQLLLLAAGHPSQDVASAADELGLALLWLAQSSQFAVWELLANRDYSKLVEVAVERHKTADESAKKLAKSIKDAAA